jgi:hypothetical protein
VTAIGSGVIVDADIDASAAIAGTKVSPDFGSQNVVTTGDVQSTSINGGPLAGMRNAIINGNFDIWQRGASTTSGYGADRWNNNISASTCTMSRQAFTVGQTDVPGEPTYFCRMAVTSVAGAANSVRMLQPVEDVRTFAGQQITVSFWAKADAAKSMSIELTQGFGTGGSPSSGITGISPAKKSLTTAWQKFTHTLNIPSISGKTLGSDGNSSIALQLWFDAGSDFNARTDTLGQQSGTFDIAQVQVEAGPVATPFERRPIGTELALCQRYYQSFNAYYLTYTAGIGTGFSQTVTFPAMRIAPAVTTSSVAFLNASGISIQSISKEKLHFGAACNNAGGVPVSAGALLALAAEL